MSCHQAQRESVLLHSMLDGLDILRGPIQIKDGEVFFVVGDFLGERAEAGASNDPTGRI